MVILPSSASNSSTSVRGRADSAFRVRSREQLQQMLERNPLDEAVGAARVFGDIAADAGGRLAGGGGSGGRLHRRPAAPAGGDE